MLKKQEISIQTSPFLKSSLSTPVVMRQVIYALLPTIIGAYYFFGLSVILHLLVSIGTCCITEYLLSPASKRVKSLKDGSAILTGILLALTLPPGFPLWMTFLGALFAIALGKSIWGGIGQNVFNPALVGRAFLQAAFPTAITTWSPPDGRYFTLRGDNLAIPFTNITTNVDAVTTETPLAKMKFSHQSTPIYNLLLGNTGGSMGETVAIFILLGGIYLIIRKIITARIPLAIFLTVFIMSGILYIINKQAFPNPLFMLCSGGLLLGAFFMATDPVTCPLTAKGEWIFGIGIGVLVVLIRLWGGLPEGVMYAILLMNAVSPLLDKFIRTRVYGTKIKHKCR